MPDVDLEVETVGSDDPRWTAAGVTARRLDYWTTNGLLHTTTGVGNPGSGYTRRWPASEVAVAGRMVRLADAGLTPAAAARAARGLELAPGIRVVIDGGQP